MRKLFLLLLFAGLAVFAFAGKKLKSGVAVVVDNQDVGHLRFGNFTYPRQYVPSPDGSTRVLNWTGFTGELYADSSDRSKGLYTFAHDVGVGKNGSDNRFPFTLQFKNVDGGGLMHIDYTDATVTGMHFPGSQEIIDGHGVGLEVLSPTLRKDSGFDDAGTMVPDPRVPIWNNLSVQIDGLDTSNVASVSGFTWRFANGPRQTTSLDSIAVDIKTKNTNITDVYVDGQSGARTRHITLTYTNPSGHKLFVDLGQAVLRKIDDFFLFDPDSWHAEFQVLGPIDFSYI